MQGDLVRQFIDGRLSLPERLVAQTDSQEFTLNWTSRSDSTATTIVCGARSNAMAGLGFRRWTPRLEMGSAKP